MRRETAPAHALRAVLATVAAALYALVITSGIVSYGFQLSSLGPIALALAVAAGLWARKPWAWWMGLGMSGLGLVRFLPSLVADPRQSAFLLHSTAAPFVLLLFVALLAPSTRKICRVTAPA